MINDKIFFDEKDPTGISYDTPFVVFGSFNGRLWSKTPEGTVKFYVQGEDIVNDLVTGGVDKVLSAEQGVTLEDTKLEGSFKQFFKDPFIQGTTGFNTGTDVVSITGLVVGRTYEIDYFANVLSGAEDNFRVSVVIRHDGVDFKEGTGRGTRPVGRYNEVIVRTRHTFIATATTASIRCTEIVGGTGTNLHKQNCVVREYINMPESITIGITGV